MKSPEEMLREMDESRDEQAPDQISPIKIIKLDVKGSRGKRYSGEFTFHVPNIGDQIRIGKLKAEYLPNGAMADPNAGMLVEQTCYLAVTIRKAPKWWQPFALYDAAPISALYAEGTAYEASFHGSRPDLSGDEEASGEAGEDDGRANVAGSSTVGRKVQPPAKRRETLTADNP